MVNLQTLINVDPAYHWKLISSDPDDDKFVDAYVSGDADYLVTNDHHLDVAGKSAFPKINIIRADEFLAMLTNQLFNQ